MDDAATSSSIRQMANFILQEAHEKVNEIKTKTEHDFNVEQQSLVSNGKAKIREEYQQKEKDGAIQDRIARSTMIGESRVKKMRSRDELLHDLVEQCSKEMSKVAASPQYPSILRGLIKQGLLKIEEEKVELFCREADIPIVKGELEAAVAEYTEMMKTEARRTVKPQVTLNEVPKRCLSADLSGGVVLTACNGRIVCDNSLKARLEIAYQELLPKIRETLFPVST
ncbi:unnamed protein product [Chrysoparadoxa australica]